MTFLRDVIDYSGQYESLVNISIINKGLIMKHSFRELVSILFAASGSPVADDAPKDVKQLQKAADQGDAEAQFKLAVCYYEGDGIKQDKAEAVKWYRKAAEQGDAEAQYLLGYDYAIGDGVDENEAEAVKWLRRAAEQGHEKAKETLKKMGY